MAVARSISRVRVKYADLAEKVTGGSSMRGRKNESTIDRWLDAKMAPPRAGPFAAPVIEGRHSRCRMGPATALETRYCTRPPVTVADRTAAPRCGSSTITAQAAPATPPACPALD